MRLSGGSRVYLHGALFNQCDNNPDADTASDKE